MEPKTKAQKAIVEIQKHLPQITDAQKAWAKSHCLDHEAVRLKSGKITCLDCGYVWHEDLQAWKLNMVDNTDCPGCGVPVIVTDTKKQKFHNWAYFHIITVFKGWQVVRLFRVSGRYFSGLPAEIGIREIGQMWIGEKKCFDFGLYQGYGGNWAGSFELRTGSGGYGFDCKIHPDIKILPELKKRGFKKSFHGLYPFRIFKMLLTETFAETLLKAKQYSLLKYFADGYHRREIEKYWPSIKIAMRNKYIVKDAGTWIDYLDLLIHFNKDLYNAKYVCPDNLKAVHDKYVAKKQALYERQKFEKRKYEIEEAQVLYAEMKAKFFGLQFSENNITVKVLENVREFLEEGTAHKHCLFTNEYYKKPDSLILSARVDDTPVETVEVSLSQLKILQARGYGNKATGYHDEIISLVNKNLHHIRAAV